VLDYPDATATPDAIWISTKADLSNVMSRLDVTSPRALVVYPPKSNLFLRGAVVDAYATTSKYDSVYLCQELPLVKPGTTGLTTAVQPSLISYLTGMADRIDRYGYNVEEFISPVIWDYSGGQWTQDTVASHQPTFVSTVAGHDPYSVVPSYLYAVTADIETGKLASAAKVPECRRRSATASQILPSLGMTWPLGVRSLKGYAARSEFDDWLGMRLVWCPRPDNWRFYGAPTDYGGSTVNSPGGTIPDDGQPMGWVNGIPYDSVIPDANDTMASGGTNGIWRTLAEFWSPVSGAGTSGFEDLTLIDPPAAGTEIWITGSQFYDLFGTPSPFPFTWELYPEASVLPWALSKLGGGAIVGGTG